MSSKQINFTLYYEAKSIAVIKKELKRITRRLEQVERI